MITATFVGLGLTSLPRLLRVFEHPLQVRPDVSLASAFPAWVAADYGRIVFPNEDIDLAEVTINGNDHTWSIEVEDAPFDDAAKRGPISLGQSPALKDIKLEDGDELNSLAACRSMYSLLVYRPDVDISANDIDDAQAANAIVIVEETCIFPFASLLSIDELPDVDSKPKPAVNPVFTTGLRADAPELKLPSRPLAAASAPTPSVLRVDAVAFTPRGGADVRARTLAPLVLRADIAAFIPRGSFQPVAAPTVPTPLRKDAPTFEPRSALVIAHASCVDVPPPRHVLSLEAPLRRRRRGRRTSAAIDAS